MKFLAAISSAIFAGGAFYISLVEHPARISLGVAAALQEFRPSYKRAAPLQVLMAVVCFLACGILWFSTHRAGWIMGGAIVVLVIPFTLVIIMPTNRILLDSSSPPDDKQASLLLKKWGHLHGVRTVLGLAGFVVILLQLIQGR